MDIDICSQLSTDFPGSLQQHQWQKLLLKLQLELCQMDRFITTEFQKRSLPIEEDNSSPSFYIYFNFIEWSFFKFFNPQLNPTLIGLFSQPTLIGAIQF